MSTKKSFTVTKSSEISKMYFIHFVLNALVLIIFNLIAPKAVVFGTEFITPSWGIFHAVSLLSLVGILFVPVFELIREKLQRELSMQDWMLGYFIINFISIWVITRFAEQLGFGISAWWVGGLIAIILDFAQGFGATLVYKKNN